MRTNKQKIMNKQYETIQKSSFPDNVKYYWGYQYRLASEVLVKMLKKLGSFKEGDRVAEIGCAEGGVLAAFVQEGAKDALGTDIVTRRLETGEKVMDMLKIPIKFVEHDIINEPLEPEWQENYDLALLRDVIEHLDDAEIALKKIRGMLKPGGRLFVTFPPYHSPFGGHQQTLANFWGKLPYIHLLPYSIFKKMMKTGRPNDVGEVKRLHKIRMTPEKFISAAKNAGYEIENQDYYLLRPVFKMKFGLPSLKITPLAKANFIRKFFSLEAAYLLKNPRKDS